MDAIVHGMEVGDACGLELLRQEQTNWEVADQRVDRLELQREGLVVVDGDHGEWHDEHDGHLTIAPILIVLLVHGQFEYVDSDGDVGKGAVGVVGEQARPLLEHTLEEVDDGDGGHECHGIVAEVVVGIVDLLLPRAGIPDDIVPLRIYCGHGKCVDVPWVLLQLNITRYVVRLNTKNPMGHDSLAMLHPILALACQRHVQRSGAAAVDLEGTLCDLQPILVLDLAVPLNETLIVAMVDFPVRVAAEVNVCVEAETSCCLKFDAQRQCAGGAQTGTTFAFFWKDFRSLLHHQKYLRVAAGRMMENVVNDVSD